jgi:hypothetical protein
LAAGIGLLAILSGRNRIPATAVKLWWRGY